MNTIVVGSETKKLKDITVSDFNRMVDMPLIKTINRSTVDPYNVNNSIYVVAHDTTNKVITLNYIPKEILKIYSSAGVPRYKWSLWSYPTSAVNHNLMGRCDVDWVDVNKNKIYYTTLYKNTITVGQQACFQNPFANMEYLKKDFLWYKGMSMTRNGVTSQMYTSFPVGMMKRNGKYRIITLSHRYGVTGRDYRWFPVFEFENERDFDYTNPIKIINYQDFVAAKGSETLPVNSNLFLLRFIRNIGLDKIECYTETNLGSNNYIYIFEIDFDLNITNIREYPLIYGTTYNSGSASTGGFFLNGEYHFEYFDVMPGGASTWKVRDYILSGNQVIYNNRDFPYQYPADRSAHPGNTFTMSMKHCHYRGLDLMVSQMRAENTYNNNVGSICNGIHYYDKADGFIKNLSSNNIWNFPTEIKDLSSAYNPYGHGSSFRAYDTNLGWDHVGECAMFYDSESDILFFMGSETCGSDDYSPSIARVRINKIAEILIEVEESSK